MNKVIELKKIEKEFKVNNGEIIKAVKGINMNVYEGEKVGYIGLNGAGKSTTIKILTGLINPTRGDINVLGLNPFLDRKKYVKNIGVVFGQRNQLFWDLTVQDSFFFNKKLYKVSDNLYNEKLSFFYKFLDLESIMHKPVMTLSLGQRMRANIAISMLHSPKILFLDEPTIGIDFNVKNEIRKLLNTFNQLEKSTILFTSHDMKDIENICDRIILLKEGKIVEDLPLKKFNEKFGQGKSVIINYFFEDDEVASFFSDDFKEKLNNFHINGEKKEISLVFSDNKIKLSDVLLYLENKGFNTTLSKISSDTLEDAIKKAGASYD